MHPARHILVFQYADCRCRSANLTRQPWQDSQTLLPAFLEFAFDFRIAPFSQEIVNGLVPQPRRIGLLRLILDGRCINEAFGCRKRTIKIPVRALCKHVNIRK